MSNPIERISNLVSATASASSQRARGLARHAIGLKSLPLTLRKSPTAAKAMRLASGLIAAALLGLLVFVLVAPHFGFVFLTMMGDSMAPALPAGSVAIVQPVATSEVRVGDIIAYRSGAERSPIVTHRVTQVLSQEGSVSFQTGGDRNEEPDTNPVASSSVVGKVTLDVPFVGFVLNFIRQPVGYGLLVGLPAMALIVVMVRRLAGQMGSLKESDGDRMS